MSLFLAFFIFGTVFAYLECNEKICFLKNNRKRRIKMKQTLKRIIRTVKSVKGNSLAEFATTTALMATLAATAAPKLSEMSEGAKAEKSRNELDKLVKEAGQFYQDTADIEGRGRFPGQDKFNIPVTGAGSTYSNNTADHSNHVSNSAGHERKILLDLGLTTYDASTDGQTNNGGYTSFTEDTYSVWISVFGEANADFPAAAQTQHYKIEDDSDDLADCNTCPRDAEGNAVSTVGKEEWKKLSVVKLLEASTRMDILFIRL